MKFYARFEREWWDIRSECESLWLGYYFEGVPSRYMYELTIFSQYPYIKTDNYIDYNVEEYFADPVFPTETELGLFSIETGVRLEDLIEMYKELHKHRNKICTG